MFFFETSDLCSRTGCLESQNQSRANLARIGFSLIPTLVFNAFIGITRYLLVVFLFWTVCLDQLSIASSAIPMLSPAAHGQHNLYSPNHSSSVSPLSTASSSSGLVPPNAHAQLPLCSRRKSLLAIANPNILSFGCSESNLIASETKHPLLTAAVKGSRSPRLSRSRSRSRNFEKQLTKNDRSNDSLTASSPDFQLLGVNAEYNHLGNAERSVKGIVH